MQTDSDADGAALNWQTFLQSHEGLAQNELALTAIAPGDRVLVKTRNTHYLLSWRGGDMATLRTSSAKAPSGAVRVMGCSFGLSSSIRPDALFCGGNLELTHLDGERTWTTSEIKEIHLLHRLDANSESSP